MPYELNDYFKLVFIGSYETPLWIEGDVSTSSIVDDGKGGQFIVYKIITSNGIIYVRRKLFENDLLPMVDTILILIYTGMRIEELLSLTKFHVYFKEMLITGGVKTDAGRDRIIPIHPKIQKYVLPTVKI